MYVYNIYIYVCVCVYVCVLCKYTCESVAILFTINTIHTCVMYVCTYVRMYVCTYVRMYVCTYVRM